MLTLDFDIAGLRGADYNPRHIDGEDLEKLAESIRELGLVKPLIVRGDLLVAGHQRTKALRLLGTEKAAVFELSRDTTVYDEIRFNQLHNGTDMDSGDEHCFISGLKGHHGFIQVTADRITGNYRSRLAYVRREISDMLLKYGSWGGCVATESGEVIHCAQYALACKHLAVPLTVYVIPDSMREKYKKYLDRSYGVFNYEHLDKKTYVQTYAQMMRLRTTGVKSIKSRLYENLTIPWLLKQPDGKKLRGIDFGSGQGDYARLLRKQGYNLLDVELYRRRGAGNVIDSSAVHRMITAMCESVRKHGPFDYVICDSVLNSVDSLQAEHAVLTFIASLCKPDGALFFSGRRLKFIQDMMRCMQAATRTGQIYFFDENNFSAKYRKGNWFYQKFHADEDIKKIGDKYGLTIKSHVCSDSSYQVHAVPTKQQPHHELESAIRFEFELPFPDGNPIGRSEGVLSAFRQGGHSD
ncbi:methyltransferase domain-containing protein [Escherichia coli]